nr:MAG: ORF1 [TTV-like mini virus]UGV37058.1 MAG: ORF1 [TTV-like mini virus]
MPYYWRPWRRRRRRFWRRRARKTFRRRFWRRRPYRVRHFKRKLKKIIVKQWQPPKINKLKIQGMYPLYEGTTERLVNNNTQWIDSTAPHDYPGGGCFSINVFSLNALYELHTKARNWWTHSNCNLPLIRYTGCKMQLYRSTNSDYIFVYSNCGSMKATEQMFQSTQPSVLALNKHKVIVTCDPHNTKRKPYKTVRIRPPSTLTNKWYFQQELANIPLLMTITSAASLGRYYIPSTAISTTIGFETLNTDFFQYHNFKTPQATTGYKPNDQFLMFALEGLTTTVETAKYVNLIYLANTKDFTPGTPLGDKNYTLDNDWHGRVETYFSTLKSWGNPFYSPYMDNDAPHVLVTNKSLLDIKTAAKMNKGQNKIEGFTVMTQPKHFECRYNPQADTSHNAIFLSPITDNNTKWEEPNNDRLITKGLPIWLLVQGWVDYHAKAQDIQRLMTDYCLCIVSDHISPKKNYYVPLDHFFLEGKSNYHYQEGLKTASDQLNWHPKLNNQVSTINKIASTGPGTVKLPDKISTEAHCRYTFYFKVGGCPPPMDEVCDPKKQPKYPTPDNILSSTLLQNPATPPQYYLYSFDQRRGLITEKAAKRIKTDWDTKELISSPTGTTALDIQLKTPETTSEEDSSSEEKDQETLQLKLQRHRRKQRKLRERILQLLKLTQKLE